MNKSLKPLALLSLSATLSVFVLAGISLNANNLFLKGEGTSGCASITFAPASTGTNALTTLEGSYSTNNISVASSSSLSYVYPEKSDAIRLSNSSNAGTFTLNFAATYSIAQVSVYAYYYGTNDATASLAFSSSDSSFSGSVAIDQASSSKFALYSTYSEPHSVSSMTFTATKRLYLSQIVFYLTGSSGETSSSSASSTSSSISSSTATFSTSSATPSSSSSSNSSGYYRIEPVTTSGSTLNVYNVDGTVNRTLTKNSWYIEPDDVALYYQGFGTYPDNYQYDDGTTATRKSYIVTYGTSARLYSKDYSSNTGYMTQLPAVNEYKYVELDIGGASTNPSYNNGTSISRGTYRLVVVYKGCTQYGNTNPVIFYTQDHYSNFQEFYNYAGGWGPSFAGRSDYVTPATINLPSA